MSENKAFSPKSADEVARFVEAELAAMNDPVLVARVRDLLREPVAMTLEWEYGRNEPYTAWRFADLGERDVWVAYCAFGHGARGCPWGLVLADSSHFGSDFGWYSDLKQLFVAELPPGRE